MTQPPEYDLKETVNSTSISTSKSGISPTLVLPLIVLIVAILAALAWWFLSRSTTTTTLPVDTTSPVTTTTTAPPTDMATMPADSMGTNGDMPVNPDNASSVMTAAEIGGINPREPLHALSGTNPFNPLKGKEIKTQAIGNTSSNSATTTPKNFNTADSAAYDQPQVTISEPRSSLASVQSAMNTGLNNSNSGLATARRGINHVNNNVTREQSMTWNTTNNNDTSGTQTTTNNAYHSNSNIGEHIVQSSDNSHYVQSQDSANQTTTASNMDNKVSEGKAQPVRAPLVGMTRPQKISVPDSIKSPSSVAASSATLPNPSIPTALDSMPAPMTTTPTEPAPKTTPITQYLEQHQATLSGVVIGTTNTAIFKTKHGFVIVAENQKIPKTNIVVRDIQTQGVTLMEPHQTMALKLTK